MCCFSRPVKSVSTTRIFARFTAPALQAVVYQMRLDAPEEMAMILPIPVSKENASDDAVTFVNLERYKDFFQDLEKGFPRPQGRSKAISYGSDSKAAPALVVHSVGSFDASFVPNVKSFSRLDERFRLDEKVWDKLPSYASYGFAVFKLKEGNAEVHPMAFTFPSAMSRRLFFPTVHIHDGKVHPKEEFDHILYGQASANAVVSGWTESPEHAAAFVKVRKTKGIVDSESHVYRHSVRGLQENTDILGPLAMMGG